MNPRRRRIRRHVRKARKRAERIESRYQNQLRAAAEPHLTSYLQQFDLIPF